MQYYLVNKNAQSNGDNEVHRNDCQRLPYLENRVQLGLHYSCKSAVRKAKEMGYNANGCKYCCEECHTT